MTPSEKPEAVDLSTLEELSREDTALPDDGAMSRVAYLAQRQVQLEDALAELARREGELSAELQKVKTVDLPNAMAEVGMSSFKLTDGSEVTVRPFASANLSQSNPDREQFYAWLEREGHGDLLKRLVSVSLGRESDEDAEKIREAIASLGFEPQETVSAHNATICAFLKEQIAAGNKVPLDLCRGFVGQAAKVTRPKSDS